MTDPDRLHRTSKEMLVELEEWLNPFWFRLPSKTTTECQRLIAKLKIGIDRKQEIIDMLSDELDTRSSLLQEVL